MITWGCGFARWKPRKELRWFWMGDPCTLMIDGCGPFDDDKVDAALADFHKPNDEMRDGERKTSEDTTDHL
jgi:hypothetical protein